LTLPNIQVFRISANHLSGVIPVSLSNASNLEFLELSENKFSGGVPAVLGYLKKLSWLGVIGNNLGKGQANELSFTTSLVNQTQLIELNLDGNNFGGQIPSSLANLSTHLQAFEQNNLQGSIPSSLGNCKNLFLLRLYSNELNGTIPPELVSLPSLSKSLDLDQNRLIGPLLMEVGNLKTLVKLNVSHNELSGEIPSSLGGDVPVGRVFNNVTALSLVGNDKLCGGIPKLQLPSCLLKKPRRKNMSLPLKLTISLIFGLVGLFLILFAMLFYLFKMQRKCSSTKSSLLDPFMKISYDDLLKATDVFSSGNLIGIGSFGSVYKGVLEDQTYVAMKVLNLQRIRASKSFFSECKALRNIRHRNLVKILTACSSVDYQGKEFKALVYEFMPNKSLETWLHSPLDEEQEQPRSLSLCQRLNIITDVAAAVDYLHHHCELPIIHCDIKPSNVLLDDSMTAHLGDFSLARIIADSNSEVISDQTSSVGLKGTIGYAAPGKRPTDDMFRDGLNLHKLVQMCLDENVEDMVDPTLVLGEAAAEPRPHLKGINECLISLLRIGEACSRELPRDRMEIHDALNHLLKLKTMF
ncbi:hypothetical protein Gotri_016070, partial [Gossypium trilobum]|nr:hypothetical protein [Gossypium trilobum]